MGLTHQFHQAELGTHPLCREEIAATNVIKKWIGDYSRRLGMDTETAQQLQTWLQEVCLVPEAVHVRRVLESKQPDEEKADYLTERFGSDLEQLAMREGWEERKRLYELLDEIAAKSRGRFSEREQVFREFARAHFAGNLLPIARLIEGTLGKGSFRRLAYALRQEGANA